MPAEPITLRELDVVFDAGVPEQTLTLYPEDDIRFMKSGDIIVTFRERSHEVIRMSGRHIRWFSMRERIVKPRAVETPE
jgi:hypothetical protein